jgi:hypothetical protein
VQAQTLEVPWQEEELREQEEEQRDGPGRVRAQELHFCMKFNLPY